MLPVAVVFAGTPLTAAGIVLAAVVLLTRYAYPIASLAIGAALGVAASFAPGPALLVLPWPVSVLLAYTAGRQVRDTRRAGAALATAGLVQIVASLAALLGQDRFTPAGAAVEFLAIALAAGLPGVTGMFHGQRDRTVEALHERNRLLERANLLGESRARMRERARIAGEMHDLLGHRLSLIVLHAGALEVRTRQSAPEVSEQADLLRVTSRTALDELRAVLGILRLDGSAAPDGTDSGVGTRVDVTRLVGESRDAGVPISLSWAGDDLAEADPGVRRAVHRIVREALANVHKHAPGATTTVTVTAGPDRVGLEVRNDLRPPAVPVPGSGLGLTGLRERVRLAGGTLTAGADTDADVFLVGVTLPRHPGPAAPDPTIDRVALEDRQMPGAAPGTEAGCSPEAARRSTPPMSKTTTKVALVAAGAGVVLCGGLGLGVYHLFQRTITAQTYQDIRPGDPQDQVRELTGGDTMVAREAVEGHGPDVPGGATCDHVLAAGFESVYRFCFTDGTLLRKDTIAVP
ncbi:putative two-component system sensor kinase [Actinoplanes missouriensis 431]|uniref:histidine kinase n=2 Tax=Actinoplanes missouriensis TaxID=1866 RepID=I0H338_ACTM4|nr:putative two-component system sensor kinase [Actinoplanes missouriensis 431]